MTSRAHVLYPSRDNPNHPPTGAPGFQATTAHHHADFVIEVIKTEKAYATGRFVPKLAVFCVHHRCFNTTL